MERQCGLCGEKKGLLWDKANNCYICPECNIRKVVFCPDDRALTTGDAKCYGDEE